MADWPDLPYDAWRDTRDTLHLYLQVIGKVRLALAPMEPQWGQVPLYVTARGLNTSPIPHPNGPFDIDVDFIDHVVSVRTTRGAREHVRLEPRTVADFHDLMLGALSAAGVSTEISELPSEVPNPIRFPDDDQHASYDAKWAHRFWRVLTSVDTVFREHRARFRGKVSAVQFFWGSFDLAYTRFSGKPETPRANAGVIERYSADAEQASAGFWPGNAATPEPTFFAYTAPAPPGIEKVAGWSVEAGEFLLPYEAVRTAADPRATLLDFLETTYRAGAELGGWDPALAPV